MFGKYRKGYVPPSPLNEDRRIWIEDSFKWLLKNFDQQAISNRKVLIPHHSDFPIRYNGEAQSARDTLDIVATQMEIDPAEIELTFYDNSINEISTGSPFGNKLYTETGENEKLSGGLYYGREEDGKYHISLERKKLSSPEKMVAVLAHELAHIKLLGEGRITENDEPLTDLTTVIFGLGIFNANAAFTSYSNFRSHGWSKTGYLTQMEWGHGLALFAHFRKEKSPDWITHLTKNVKSDFLKSEQYIVHHNPATR